MTQCCTLNTWMSHCNFDVHCQRNLKFHVAVMFRNCERCWNSPRRHNCGNWLFWLQKLIFFFFIVKLQSTLSWLLWQSTDNWPPCPWCCVWTSRPARLQSWLQLPAVLPVKRNQTSTAWWQTWAPWNVQLAVRISMTHFLSVVSVLCVVSVTP